GGRCRRSAGREDHVNLAPDELGGQCRQPIIVALRPAIFDRQILSLDIVGFTQSLAECCQNRFIWSRQGAAEKAHHWHRLLLRARRQRPSRYRAADQGDDLAAQHAQDTGDAPAAILIGVRRSSVSKRWQATKRSSTSVSVGSASAQRGIACGQRGWKRHPEGGLSGLGTSPERMISSRRSSGWLGSAAENNASV